MPSSLLRQPNFAVLLILLWLAVALVLLVANWPQTGETLIDTDDAMRLAQMRDWLAGQGCYDLVQRRVEPPAGYESHWSRLIDAGLAGTLMVFGLFAGDTLAERLMRAVWPLLWLLPAMTGVVAVAWRVAGRNAALVTLVLIAVGRPAFAQFVPGRIDHHNVQIALSLLVLAATVWSDRVRWAAAAAGASTGLALAIGLECLPYLMVCTAAFAARYVFDRNGARAATDYGLALAASTAVAFFVSVGPEHWTRGVCDALAVNWVAPLVAGGLGLALAGRFAVARLSVRLACALGIGAVAAALFVAIEPRCLRGPFAMMDPAVVPIWLANVTEMQSLAEMTRDSPAMGAGFAAFPFAALVCAFVLARRREFRIDWGFQVSTGALAVGIALMAAAARMSFGAMWLGMPLVAAAAIRLFERFKLESLAVRVFVAIMLAPAVLSASALLVVQAVARTPAEPEQDTRYARGCFTTANYAPLAGLPAGLIATDIDFGAFLVALTPHSVLAAPYHRLSAGIITAHEALAAPPEQAQHILTVMA